MTLRRRHTITAAVANELSTSLRAKRGNPEQRKQNWIASSQELLAMTWRGQATIARHLRADLSTSSSLRRQHCAPDQLACCNSTSAWFALANGIGVTGIGAIFLLRPARAGWSRRRNPPSWRFITADHDPPELGGLATTYKILYIQFYDRIQACRVPRKRT
jgi:hypothetical protein